MRTVTLAGLTSYTSRGSEHKVTEVTVRKYVKNLNNNKIIARVNRIGRVVLWDGSAEYNAHKDDTDEQLDARLKAIIEGTV